MNHDAADMEGPSKSARKRAAEEAQRLGERLIALEEGELEALGLPERLRDAVREARHIGSRAAGARQRQYIGRLMRDVDTEALAAALAARSRGAALEAGRFRLIERWRDRLIAEGEPALAALAALEPRAGEPPWQTLVARARDPAAADAARRTAGRELFRALRALLGSDAPAD